MMSSGSTEVAPMLGQLRDDTGVSPSIITYASAQNLEQKVTRDGGDMTCRYYASGKLTSHDA